MDILEMVRVRLAQRVSKVRADLVEEIERRLAGADLSEAFGDISGDVRSLISQSDSLKPLVFVGDYSNDVVSSSGIKQSVRDTLAIKQRVGGGDGWGDRRFSEASITRERHSVDESDSRIDSVSCEGQAGRFDVKQALARALRQRGVR